MAALVFALLVQAQVSPPHCFEYCTNPCSELLGEVTIECGTCTDEKYRCRPGAEGYKRKHSPHSPESEATKGARRYTNEELAGDDESLEEFEYVDGDTASADCQFEVMDHATAVAQNITSKWLYNRTMPLLIRNATLGWPAIKKWGTYERFIRNYGNADYIIEPEYRKTVRELMKQEGKYWFAHMLNPPYPPTGCYMESQRPYGSILAKAAKDYQLLDYLKPFSTFQMGAGRGGTAGVPYESHTPAWFAVVAGTKRWALTPPHEKTPRSRPDHPFVKRRESAEADAGHESCDVVRRTPKTLTCDQEAGDIVLVPDRWWHSTCSLSNWSIGIGGLEPHPIVEEKNSRQECRGLLYEVPKDVPYCVKKPSRCPVVGVPPKLGPWGSLKRLLGFKQKPFWE